MVVIGPSGVRCLFFIWCFFFGMLSLSKKGNFWATAFQPRSYFHRGLISRELATKSFAKKHEAITAPVRVRFAPSPTGSLHVGGARTAVFNWLLARKTKGSFIIRIEDTDEARSTRASEASILKDLKWLGLDWDEGPDSVSGAHGPYRQSDRKGIYKQAAQQLVDAGMAYPCFCTEEELAAKRKEAESRGMDVKYDGTWRNADPAEVQRRLAAGEAYTLRFKVPAHKTVYIDDVVRGRVTWDTDASLGDFILLRSNGMPVYNFCVAVDDAHMKITHVIRAEEHLTNTFRQLLILEALGHQPPVYAHCSLILGEDRAKLSKRHGAASVGQFALQGFLPEALLNYLANLGWSNGTPKELYSRRELQEEFDLLRMLKSPAIFDMTKLRWMNAQHIRALHAPDIQRLVLSQLTCTGPCMEELGVPQDDQAQKINLRRGGTEKDSNSDKEAQHSVVPSSHLSGGDKPAVDCNSDIASTSATIVANCKPGLCIINPVFRSWQWRSSSQECTSSSDDSIAMLQGASNPSPAVNSSSLPFEEFIACCGALAQRDMVTLVDAPGIIASCLSYDLESTVNAEPAAKDIVWGNGRENALKLAQVLIDDYARGDLPTGKEDNFVRDGMWAKYVIRLGTTLGLKGKALYHPLRLFITGRMQGAEVPDQLRLLHLSSLRGVCSTAEQVQTQKAPFIHPNYQHLVVPIRDRIARLQLLVEKSSRMTPNEVS